MPRIHRLLLAPALLFSGLLLAALLLTALLSFTDASTGVVEVRFVGAANYITQHFAGLDLESIRKRLQTELASLRDDITGLMHRCQ